ncbi:fungal-specific transcription factor domain-containing protein [Xylariomycetidae sp. FL2044]|nr:fungal-specific transcription factor domain-containing protein [Xylariomycetidae sp. FL2044]
MEIPVTARRRRRRQVPDDLRKRAPRACVACKSRKSKCIEITPGKCQRCQRNSLDCSFERRRSPVGETSPPSAGSPANSPDAPFGDVPAVSTGVAHMETDPPDRFMWPQFLSRLRETFSLNAYPASEEETISVMHAQAFRAPLLQPLELQKLQKATDAFPPRAVADFLVSMCIDHGTDSFFYFNQAQLLSEIDQFYTDPASRLRTDRTFICLAHAVFALGSHWTTLAKPNASARPLLPSDGDPGRMFYDHARALIPDIIDLPGLRSVQAPAVIGAYLLPTSAIGSSYIYLGLALKKALGMDLHLNADELGISEEEKEIRRRIWWGLYSLERASTAKLNRPKSIDQNIITVSLPRVFPEIDRLQRFNNVEHQIANAKLVKLLDRVADIAGRPDPHKNFDQLRVELKQWKHSLSPRLRLEFTPPSSSEYRANFHLSLNYYLTWVTMGRISLVQVVKSRLRYHFQQEPEPMDIDEDLESLSTSCVKAAYKILGLFEELLRSGNLARFSFVDVQGCSSATIISLLAGILERSSSYEKKINFGLDCLRMMVEGNVAAKTGLGFVEALQTITNEAWEKLQQTSTYKEQVVAQAPAPSSPYHEWIDWMSQQGLLANQEEPDGGAALGQASTLSPMPPTDPLSCPPAQPLGAGFTSWDGAAALQRLSAPSAGAASRQPDQAALDAYGGANADFISTLYSEDQALLLGLTGLDVFGFSGF